MPIYEYRCNKCGRQFEVMQKITSVPLRKCEACGGNLTKLVSQTSFMLKGTGWYLTDYARKPETFKDRDGKSESKPSSSEKSKEDKK